MLRSEEVGAPEDLDPDPPLYPSGRWVWLWLFFVVLLPLGYAVASGLYVQHQLQVRRARREAAMARKREEARAQAAARRRRKAQQERAERAFAQARFAEAEEAATSILRLSPTVPRMRWLRARARYYQGKLEEAEQDLDVLIEKLVPAEGSLRTRGLVRALQGRRGEALADLRAALRLSPRSAYTALWIAGLGGGKEALAPFLAGNAWTSELARFVAGQGSLADLLARAKKAPNDRKRRERLCEAHGYAGLLADAEGRWPAARTHYQACVATGVTEFIEYRWAEQRLRQDRPLPAGPADPPLLERDEGAPR